MTEKLEKDGWPEVNIELIRWMKEKFPLTPPRINESTQEIYFNAGRQSIIAELVEMEAYQNRSMIDQEVKVEPKYKDINLNREEDTS